MCTWNPILVESQCTFTLKLLSSYIQVQGQIRDRSLGADEGEGLAQGPSRGSLVMLRYNKPSNLWPDIQSHHGSSRFSWLIKMASEGVSMLLSWDAGCQPQSALSSVLLFRSEAAGVEVMFPAPPLRGGRPCCFALFRYSALYPPAWTAAFLTRWRKNST